MMRKVREKIMSALVVLCMILACTNSIVAKEVTISGSKCSFECSISYAY